MSSRNSPHERFVTPDGELTLLVSRDVNDLTLGFEGCEWHTHGDILTVYVGVDELASPERAVDQFLEALTHDRLQIVVVEVKGVIQDAWVLDSVSDVPTPEAGETVRVRRWSGEADRLRLR